MAIKEKDKVQKSKLLEVIKTEYKGESLILGILAIFTAAISVMILIKAPGFTIPSDFPVIGGSPNDVIFASSVLVVAILGIALVLYPFFVPAFPEIRKITWATPKQFFDHALRVIIFSSILTLVIFAYDVIILEIIKRLS